MKSIGILIYGDLSPVEVIETLNSYRFNNDLDLSSYEVCIHITDLESMQKVGIFTEQPLYEYLTKLSPNIYNFYLERIDLKTSIQQRVELLTYLKSKGSKLILVFKEGTKVSPEEMELINQLEVIKLSV